MFGRSQTPVYQATATMLVGQIMQSTSLSREDVQMSVAFAQTYSDIAVRQPVLKGVVEKLELIESWQKLRKRVRVSPVEGTQLISIVVEYDSPEMARKIADEVANQLILLSPTKSNAGEDSFVNSFIQQQIVDSQERILNSQQRVREIDAAMEGSLSPTEMAELQVEKTTLEGLIADYVKNYVELLNYAGQERKPNSLSVIESAQVGEDPIRPKVQLFGLLGGGVGVALALGLIFLLEMLDDTFRSLDDIHQFADLNILGAVGRIKGRKFSEKIIAHLEPYSPTMEAYRMVRNKLQFGSVFSPSKSIVVTSPASGEGKSITAANLGVIMAQADRKTIIVDADFRRPTLHQVFNVNRESGLGDMLISKRSEFDGYLKGTRIENLQIITNGRPLLNSSELLGSGRMSGIIKYLEGIADVIIFDSPPALLAADATILSNLADGVILVIRAGKSRCKAIRQTLSDLQKANANLLGCICNHMVKETSMEYYKGYGYIPERTLIKNIKGLFTRSANHHEKIETPSGIFRAKAIPEIFQKKYVITLSNKDREYLYQITGTDKLKGYRYKRAMIILKADEGKTDTQIMAELAVSRSCVKRVRKLYATKGLERVLYGNIQSGETRHKNGMVEFTHPFEV